MNTQFYVEKLRASEDYKKFIKKNPKAYPCSGFFIIDIQNNKDNKQHIDFFVPEQKNTGTTGKIISFQLENNCKYVELKNIDNKIPEKIDLNINIDFNEIENLILDKMSKNNIKNKIQKLLFSLQKLKNKHYLIGTVFISNLALIKIQIDIANDKILQFEKKSFFDMLKITRKKDKKQRKQGML